MEDKSAGKEGEKRNKKSREKRERECDAESRTFRRRKMRGGRKRRRMREEEESCAARYCEFVTELLLPPPCPSSFLPALLPHLLSPALRSDERVTSKARPTCSDRAHLPHFKPILIRTPPK